MTEGVNHDEHQYIAAGKLLSSFHLLPYRDYPFFHTPLLVPIYGFVFLWTDHLLFAARLISVLSAFALLVVLFRFSTEVFRTDRVFVQTGIGLATAAILFTNTTFTASYFRVWNQSLPLLMLFGCIGAHCMGARMRRAAWYGVSGVCIALAIGMRLSYAPLALPLLVMTLFVPGEAWKQRLANLLWFGAGLAVGIVPTLYFALQDPGAFWFDNFQYNGSVNAMYRGPEAVGWPAVREKLSFALSAFAKPSNALLLASFLCVTLRPIGRSHFLRLILLLLPFALWGSFAPTPSHIQYFLPVVALMVCGVVAGLSEARTDRIRFALGGSLATAALVLGIIVSFYAYGSVFRIGDIGDWTPSKIHAEARNLRQRVGVGPVLTFSPTVVLEAGLSIYPEFASGPFAWLTARFLSADQRARYHFPAESDLAEMLREWPPTGIVLGYEEHLEGVFLRYATENRFRPGKFAKKKTLWVSPTR